MTTDQRRLDRAEARLRAALEQRTAGVPPGDDAASLAAIERRLATERRRRWSGRPAGVVLAAAAAVAALLGLVAVVVDDDGAEQVRTTDTTTTSAVPTTTTTATTAPAVAPSRPDDAVWPPPNHEQYDDPVAAARSFVEEYVGFPDPPLSAFRGGQTAGEVDVHLVGEGGRVLRDRVVATILVRWSGGAWIVVGARSPDIEVDSPKALDTVGGIFVAEGRSRGYEGTIVVSVIEAGTTARRPLAQVPGIGGAGIDLEPFHLDVTIDPAPSQPAGALLFTTDTGCSGCNTSFALVPVRLGTATLAPGASTGLLTADAPLRVDGIGPITIGMTLQEATDALGAAVRLDTRDLLMPEDEAQCGYATAAGGPAQLRFMVTRDQPADAWRINRVDVDVGSAVQTAAGVGIGSTEAEVTRAYDGLPGTFEVSAHTYLGPVGHYLEYDPDGPGGMLLVFETDGRSVLAFHAGREAEARYVEGCA